MKKKYDAPSFRILLLQMDLSFLTSIDGGNEGFEDPDND